jgi:hypothetical protein
MDPPAPRQLPVSFIMSSAMPVPDRHPTPRRACVRGNGKLLCRRSDGAIDETEWTLTIVRVHEPRILPRMYYWLQAFSKPRANGLL